jgi:hypothetical protein
MRKSFILILTGCFLTLSVATASRTPARGNSLPVAAAEPAVKKRKPRPRSSEPARSVCGEQTEHIDTDLTGPELSGWVRYPAAGINDRTAATLVITEINPTSHERTFTLKAEGMPELSGRFSARSTCGYTGAAMRFADSTISVRVCREQSGVAFRSSESEGFEFIAGKEPPLGEAINWGQCYRKRGRLRGNRPL